MKCEFLLKIILALFLFSGSAYARPDSEQLRICYLAAYKKIFVDVMGIRKSNTGLKTESDVVFNKALDTSAYYAAAKNGLIDVEPIDGEVSATQVAKFPEDLLGVSRGATMTPAMLESRLGKPLFLGLATDSTMYLSRLNASLKSGGFAAKIRAISVCKGVF